MRRTRFVVPEPQHIKAKKGEIAERAVISGDPARVTQLSRSLKDARLVNDYRGFLTYTGEYEGKKVTLACHGVGGPSAAIVVEELIMHGAKAIVRLGTCGGLQEQMKVGDMVIATGAGYLSGTLDHYFEKEHVNPVPDPELTALLVDSAKGEGIRYHTGRVFSTDSFYGEDPVHASKWSTEGYAAVEMECATVFGLGMLRKVKIACVLLVSDNMSGGEPMADARALEPYTARASGVVFNSLARTRV